MPFTISHAAAVLPLQSAGLRLPLAALMVGSLSPDFAYFLPAALPFPDSHSLVGVFTFCLPAGLAVWLFFVSLLERPTLAFLPDAWRRRIAPSDHLSRRSLWRAAAAVVLGAFTHLAWDAFTHAGTPITTAFPVFHLPLFVAGDFTVRVYFALQVLSSVFGLAVLFTWALNIRQRALLPESSAVPAHVPQVSHVDRWLALVMTGAASGVAALINLAGHEGLRIDGALFVLLIGGMIGAAVAWTLLAVTLRWRARPAGAGPQPGYD